MQAAYERPYHASPRRFRWIDGSQPPKAVRGVARIGLMFVCPRIDFGSPSFFGRRASCLRAPELLDLDFNEPLRRPNRPLIIGVAGRLASKNECGGS